jgi:hypothetical protein
LSEARLGTSLAEEVGANLNDRSVQELLQRIAQGIIENSFNTNDTGALLGAFCSQEFGFAYGHKLPVPFLSRVSPTARRLLRPIHNKIAVGGRLKYRLGVALRWEKSL